MSDTTWLRHVVSMGPIRFTVHLQSIWTSGHSTVHVCTYERTSTARTFCRWSLCCPRSTCWCRRPRCTCWAWATTAATWSGSSPSRSSTRWYTCSSSTYHFWESGFTYGKAILIFTMHYTVYIIDTVYISGRTTTTSCLCSSSRISATSSCSRTVYIQVRYP